jgi:hypothetical protein
MSNKIQNAANSAIFQLQLNTDEAIRYVVKNAQVSPKEAGLAIKEAMTGYKQR